MLMRKRAWDIMRDDFLRVDEDAELVDVVKTINRGIAKDPINNFVLVFSRDNEFRGVITMWNVLQALGPCLLQQIPLTGTVDWDETFEEALRTCSSVDIKKIMQRDLPSLKPTEPLARIMEIFLDYRRGRAIVEEGGKVMGVVLLYDICREIGAEME
ncbi:MAG: HPP family protein [Desulfovibrionales bacterium]